MNKNTFSAWKHPALLLVGIGTSNIGAWVYLLAINLMVFDMTKSPLAVAALYILFPIATLCANFWAGSFIDRLNQRNMMISLDIFRAICIFLLSFVSPLWLIYVLVFVINMATSIFEPTSMVYMTKLVPKENRQRFNALRNFINSCGYLVGPSLAGLLFIIGSLSLAIQLNAIAIFISAFILLFLPNVDRSQQKSMEKVSWHVIKKDWLEVIKFSKSSAYVAKVYLLFSGVTVFMTAMDSQEAAFAKGVLSLSNSAYGFLVSMAGLGFIAGAIVNTVFAKKLVPNTLIGIGSLFIGFGYLIYAFSNSFLMAAIGFFLLTFALTFANTGFLTFYQNNVPVGIMGRFESIFGMITSLLIIFLTVLVGGLAEMLSIRPVVIAGSVGLLLLGGVICKTVFQREKRALFAEESEHSAS
ncbi:MFS transporter [Shouchella lonarensis]|uniref:Sugar phosphate permease n=1 Tax=Shouchella lonarensis TaxID=1464122 RepID=A0A1G6NGW2_9BACI|nr:MFS transporter [Shouchella lonarensis]SDC67140.1 Sugar phosphate permease [Shouchella lonarensis]